METENRTIRMAIRNQEKTGNEFLDFSDAIFKADAEAIVEYLKENNINEFTVSSNYSNMLEVYSYFQDNGFFIMGVTKIISANVNYRTGKYDIYVPAISFRSEH